MSKTTYLNINNETKLLKSNYNATKRYLGVIEVLEAKREVQFKDLVAALFPSIKLLKPSNDELKALYFETCDELNAQRSAEKMRTIFESKLVAILKQHCRRETRQNIWIGNVNVDLFFPGFRTESVFKNQTPSVGLCVEIDGGIHNSEPKMKKDEYKYEYLHSLGLMTTVIQNNDVISEFTKTLLANLSHHRAWAKPQTKQRQWRKIYIQTLVMHRPLKLLKLYNINMDLIDRSFGVSHGEF